MPTIRFQVLYVFLVLAHDRRRILQFGVTAHPTAEWTVQQLRNAFPWESAPRGFVANSYAQQTDRVNVAHHGLESIQMASLSR